jgi:hypothetical protein
MEYVLQAAILTSLSFPHASNGNPGGIRMDPRLKYSRVTTLGSRISSPQPQFSKEYPILNERIVSGGRPSVTAS